MEIDFGQIERLFVELIDEVGESPSFFATRSREGIFSPALTMWLLVNGWAKGRRGLAAALEAIDGGEALEVISRNERTKRVVVSEVSANSGGLSRARKRLKLKEIRALVARMNEALIEEVAPQHLWHGRRVYLFDGTEISLTRSKPLVKKFPVVRNQHGEAYTPNMLCGCCHELFSGIALNPKHVSRRGKEKSCEPNMFYDMLNDLPDRSLVIADRNLGIFPVAFEAGLRGHEVLVRLTATRARTAGGKHQQGGEYVDARVTWEFPGTRAEHLKIPGDAKVEGRFIKWTVKRQGHRPLELLFFTTSAEPAEELVALYQQRERIENDIRTLKHTIGLERLFSKTPEMIEQELLLGVLAYNLVRAIIAQAAKELKLQPRQISFTRAASYIQIFGNKMRDASSPEEMQKHRTRFLNVLRQTKHPTRKNLRIEPRKIARQKQSYPPMKNSRQKEQQDARETLKQSGHRGYFTTVSRKY